MMRDFPAGSGVGIGRVYESLAAQVAADWAGFVAADGGPRNRWLPDPDASARSKGETYDPAEAFAARDFEFSAVEIGRTVDRWLRLQEAKKFAAETRKPLRKAA